LTSGVTGVLPLANGGFGTAYTDSGADRILFWDDSESKITSLSLDTGLSITTTVLSVDRPFKVVGHKDETAVAATTNITIQADKNYIVYYQGKSNAVSDDLLGIRFNDASTSYVNIGTGSAITDQVDLSNGATQDADSIFYGFIRFTTIDTVNAFVYGEVSGVYETTGNTKTAVTQIFEYTGGSPTSIELMSDGTMQNAIIIVYEMAIQ